MATGGGRMINKNRPRPASGVGSGSSSNNVSSGGRNNNSSGGNNKSPTVTTTTSYGGNYLNVDLNTDYQSIINSARDSGDYATAAYNEALRNAKLNYLGRGSEATNTYVSPYTQSVGKNGAGTNAQGGAVYDNKVKSIGNLESNWTKANINGSTYTRDNSGKIYQTVGQYADGSNNNYYVGDGFNKSTGELTYSNRDDALKAAYDKYVGSGHNTDVGYEYAVEKGLIDNGYVDALMNGTSSDYTKGIQAIAEADKHNRLRAAASANSIDDDYDEPVVQQAAAVLTENSFESDVDDGWNDYLSNQWRNQRTRIL